MMIDCIGRCKSNCPTFTATQSPLPHSSLQKENEKCYSFSFHISIFFNKGCWSSLSEVFSYIMTILYKNSYETLKKIKIEKREDHYS